MVLQQRMARHAVPWIIHLITLSKRTNNLLPGKMVKVKTKIKKTTKVKVRIKTKIKIHHTMREAMVKMMSLDKVVEKTIRRHHNGLVLMMVVEVEVLEMIPAMMMREVIGDDEVEAAGLTLDDALEVKKGEGDEKKGPHHQIREPHEPLPHHPPIVLLHR